MGVSRKYNSARQKSKNKTIRRKRPFKPGEIVLIKSRAGSAIPNIHVKLVEKNIVKPSKGNNFDWPGYTGWRCELVYKSEADMLKKNFSIPFEGPGDETYVFEEDIIKRVRSIKPEKDA